MRRANIVCTLGPATDSLEDIRHLILAGMDVARLNMSHGEYEEHGYRLQRVRQAATEVGRTVAVLADLQGPKIRTGKMADGPVMLVEGHELIITTEDILGTVERVSTGYKGMPGDVKPGHPILIDDGNIQLEVVSVEGTEIRTVVKVGGKLSDRKGINLPGAAVNVAAVTNKDLADLRWALHMGVDIIALSFVRSGADVEEVRRVMEEENIFAPVFAKIEKPQSVENLAEIIDAFDGVMVARGDLGVEMPLWEVPLVQKRAIEMARAQAKPVIVATQMLESMIKNPRPTRAEASDVANAILDGADSVMLSAETSVGDYPFMAVETMAKIIESAEEGALWRIGELTYEQQDLGSIIAAAAAEVGEKVGAMALVTFTESGTTARRLSRLRTAIPVYAFTPFQRVSRQLAIVWGVHARTITGAQHTDQMVVMVETAMLASGVAKVGDVVVIVAGSPPGVQGTTNALRVHTIGDAVNAVAPVYRRMAREGA